MVSQSTKALEESIRLIKSYLTDANRHFTRSENYPEDVYNEDEEICNYYVEKAFISLLVLLEVIGLKETYSKIDLLFTDAKKEGFSKSKMGIEDNYLVYASELQDYIDAISSSYNVDLKREVISSDIIPILRASQYTITDTDLFKSAPSSETDVHLRIEGLLKSIFGDLKHKPSLTKPIKNFVPDTGLPSIKTLIEYKFISNKTHAKIVADEILADTRGYFSREWKRFIYVIYETTRIKPENEWVALLTECDVQDTEVVVISGVPPRGKTTKRPKLKSTRSKK